ncbi:MAG: hypothetical protein AAGD35_02630 [Actinomycetota bacterium]
MTTIGLGTLAVIGLIVALVALRSAGTRSNEIDRLAEDLDAARAEQDRLSAEADRTAAELAVAESRWLSAVAVSRSHAPSVSRLLAVEAATRHPTPESSAALGTLLFADARTDAPIIELDHDGPVWVTETATDADLVLTGSDDNTATLWSPDGTPVATLRHDAEVRAAAISDNDEHIITGTWGGSVTVWGRSGERLRSVRHGDRVNAVAIDTDGTTAISGGHDGVALVFDPTTGEVRHQLDHSAIVWAVDLSANGALAATGGEDGVAVVWDAATGEELATHEAGTPITVVEFSADDRRLFVGSRDGTSLLVDVDADTSGPPLEGTRGGGVVGLDWHPDGTELAVASIRAVSRYRLPDGDLIAEHQVAGGTRGVSYGPDGSWFAIGSGDFQFNFGEITFWDATSGSLLTGVNLGGPVESISAHPSGMVLAGFRTTEDLVEVGGAWLVPGPDDWIALACEGSDGVLSEEVWSGLTGEASTRTVACP